MSENEQRIDKLFEELVPDGGKADTVAGEIIRAISQIGYRNYNDGDRLGVGYGKVTVNPAARYLMAKCGGEVRDILVSAWETYNDDTYEKLLNAAGNAVIAYLDAHPELKEQANSEDMWSYRNKYEDRDDTEN